MEKIESLIGKSFLTSTACMSVLADALSYANAHPTKIVKNVSEADNIVVLSCQVTDLAILNDIKTIEKYKKEFPDKNFYISGCLAKREDIHIPEFAERLETPRENYQHINDRTLVNYEPPFWVLDFKNKDSPTTQGHLFRDMYPLRISKGCPNKCSYCTINITRGAFEKLKTELLEEEFLKFDNILLIADSPTPNQIKQWYDIAIKHNKPFSIRNVEPGVTVSSEEMLYNLAEKKLLNTYHSPIQSSNEEVLKDMNRSITSMKDTMRIAKNLQNMGVYIATNIIIDYKGIRQDFSDVYSLYDYVSWNPLWDSNWNRQKAEERFSKYITSGIEPSEVAQAKAHSRLTK